MKIGFDAKRAFHNFRGLGNYSRNLLEGLFKYYPNEEYYLYTPAFQDKRAIEWGKRNSLGKIITPNKMRGKIMSSAWRSLFLTSALKQDQIDIYHGLSHELPPGIGKSKIKSIVTIHDLIFMRYPEFFPQIDRWVYKKKFSSAIDMADMVLAICEQTKEDLIELLKCPADKIRVHHQSCSPEYYYRKSEEELENVFKKFELPEFYILYVGALEERKNALSLVKAFSRIKDHIPHDLILVGQGKEYKKLIEKEIVNQGLQLRVKILSHVDNIDLPCIYQGASLFVLPSFFEGWGVPIVEALFSETPVITSKGSCFPESAGDYSLFIDPNCIEDLADKMEKVLFDEDMQKEMSTRGRMHAEKFHWKNTTDNLMDIYSKI
jgi:glycosyltransferase involved in cell wall biosynthesis